MHVALVEPEIPQNTGSIARTCAATKTPLHLIGKLGFELSEKRIRRAGLDYWPYVELHQYSDWEEFQEIFSDSSCWFFSKHGTRAYYEAEFGPNDVLVFGSETKGLGSKFLADKDPNCVLKIPMKCEQVRSLNLSNATNIALFEALRQSKLI